MASINNLPGFFWLYIPKDTDAWGSTDPLAFDDALDNIIEQKGSPGGIASLDETGKIPSTQLPSNTGNPNNDNVVLASVPCDISVEIGDIVIMSNGTALQASAATFILSNVVGIVDSKESPTLCDIRTSGVSNSIYSGLDTTLDYFLSDIQPGKLTSTAPTAPGTVIVRVGQAFTSTSLLVEKSLRMIRS